MTYKLRDKRDRNERLIKYHLERPDITMKSLGRIFRISESRVSQLLKRIKDGTTS